MYRDTIVLTETEKTIFKSYKNTLSGLATYMGEGYEFVLHSLESFEHSVIFIENGFHTNRKLGSPITDLALRMLDQIERGDLGDTIIYFSKNRDGAPMKSTTIAIRGEHGRIIGLLCINFYMNISLAKLLKSFTDSETTVHSNLTETFVESTDELVANIIHKVREEVLKDDLILPSCKNKEIIYEIYLQGVFQFRNAVSICAEILEISKNTVYLHLRTAQDKAKSATIE